MEKATISLGNVPAIGNALVASYLHVSLRAIENADMFGHHIVRHRLSHLKTTYYERYIR
jgi:hypothetical protein